MERTFERFLCQELVTLGYGDVDRRGPPGLRGTPARLVPPGVVGWPPVRRRRRFGRRL